MTGRIFLGLLFLVALTMASVTRCKTTSSENSLYSPKRLAPRDCPLMNVCQVDCKKIIPNCQNKKSVVFYNLPISGSPVDHDAYRKVCLFEGKNNKYPFWRDYDGLKTIASMNPAIGKILAGKKTWKECFDTVLSHPTVSERNTALALLKLVNVYHLFEKAVVGIPSWRRNIRNRINVISRIKYRSPKVIKLLYGTYPITSIAKVRSAFINRNLHRIYVGTAHPFARQVKYAKIQLDLTCSKLSTVEKLVYAKFANKLKTNFIEYMEDLSEQTSDDTCQCTDFGEYTQDKMALYNTKDAANRTRVVRSLIRNRIIPRVPKNITITTETRTIRNANFALKMFNKSASRRIKRIINHCRVRVCGKKSVKKPIKKAANVPKGSAKGSSSASGSKKVIPSGSKSVSTPPVLPKTRGPSFIPGSHSGYGKK